VDAAFWPVGVAGADWPPRLADGFRPHGNPFTISGIPEMVVQSALPVLRLATGSAPVQGQVFGPGSGTASALGTAASRSGTAPSSAGPGPFWGVCDDRFRSQCRG
jgi:hypothetical protein